MFDQKLRMMVASRIPGIVAVLALLLAGWSGAAAAPTVEEAAIDGVWSMGISARTNAPGIGDFTYGAHFVVTTEGGDYIGECILPFAESPVPSHNCRVDVPSDRISLVWEDLDSIPAGYAPEVNPIVFDPTIFTTGPHNIGAFFTNLPVGGSTVISRTSDIAIFTDEAGQSAYDACYILVGYSNEGCDENQDGRVMFDDIPWGTYTVHQTADLGPGRHVDDFTIEVRGNISSAGWEGFSATIVNSTGGSVVQLQPNGEVDIALITRDPQDGHLLTGTCYVLVDYSNEGCDENGDGQVTFAAIPYGTYTVRQTRTPAGYPSINDYAIHVEPVQGMPGGEPFGVPLGFIVKQAPDQNAPDTRNVSVVLIDMTTHEKIPAGACVELVGASNVGCDEDLIDGQIDFLDVPAGGPYELRFTNLPAGYEVGTVGGPLSVKIDAKPGDPSNRMIFVMLAVPR